MIIPVIEVPWRDRTHGHSSHRSTLEGPHSWSFQSSKYPGGTALMVIPVVEVPWRDRTHGHSSHQSTLEGPHS